MMKGPMSLKHDLATLAIISKHLRIEKPDTIDFMWMSEEERAEYELDDEDREGFKASH